MRQGGEKVSQRTPKAPFWGARGSLLRAFAGKVPNAKPSIITVVPAHSRGPERFFFAFKLHMGTQRAPEGVFFAFHGHFWCQSCAQGRPKGAQGSPKEPQRRPKGSPGTPENHQKIDLVPGRPAKPRKIDPGRLRGYPPGPRGGEIASKLLRKRYEKIRGSDALPRAKRTLDT